MFNYAVVLVSAAVAVALLRAGPLALHKFFGAVHPGEVDAPTKEVAEAEDEKLRVHRKRRLNALWWGGLVPVIGFAIAALVGLTRAHADVVADRFLAGLGLYTAVLVAISAGAQVVAHLEPEHRLSPYIDLAGKTGVLVTAAITVGMLLTENGIDLLSGV